MKIGIRAHDLSSRNLKDILKEAYNYGFSCIQFVEDKAINGADGILTLNKCEQYLNDEATSPVKIAMIGAYFNPLEMDEEKRIKAIKRFESSLVYAKTLGVEYVGTETGFYLNDRFLSHSINRSEAAYLENMRILKGLNDVAKQNGTYLTIEGAYHQVAYSPQVLQRIVRELGGENVRVIIDLYNYLAPENEKERYQIFDDCLRLLGDKIVIFHLKNYQVYADKLVQVSLEKGLIDYHIILKKIQKAVPDAYLIFEGITGENIAPSIKYIKEILKEIA